MYEFQKYDMSARLISGEFLEPRRLARALSESHIRDNFNDPEHKHVCGTALMYATFPLNEAYASPKLLKTVFTISASWPIGDDKRRPASLVVVAAEGDAVDSSPAVVTGVLASEEA